MRRDLSLRMPGWRRVRGLIGWGWIPLIVTAVAGCAGSAPVRYQEQARALEQAQASPVGVVEDDVFAEAADLDRAVLVREIIARNPTVQSARHAWRAALQRVPQVTALDDPVVGYGAAPRSFGASGVDSGHVVDLSQAIPFPGKLGLRGQAALAEAEAARGDFRGVQLRLATMGSLLFDDYYFATRARAINAEHVALLESFQRIALARYEVGEATQQDPLQAEVELVRLLQRDLELRSRVRVARQQLNTLLHRSVEAALPPAPQVLVAPSLPFGDVSAAPLTASALDARPELGAAEARVRAREADVRVARLEFLPDFTLVGNYNSRVQVSENRLFVGARFNVPLQLGRRRAALAQAHAELARAEREREGVADGVRLAVHRSLEEYHQARAVAALFETRLLAAARDRVDAARSGFETGRNSLLELIDAERELRRVELDREQAVADVSRRAAQLLRGVGRTPGLDGAER